jgi:hypothetical protein
LDAIPFLEGKRRVKGECLLLLFGVRVLADRLECGGYLVRHRVRANSVLSFHNPEGGPPIRARVPRLLQQLRLEPIALVRVEDNNGLNTEEPRQPRRS